MTIVRIVDINPHVIEAAKKIFDGIPGVECVVGNMMDQDVDVWVTPTNSKGNMSGGLDAVIKNHLGDYIQMAIRAEISDKFDGTLPIGRAVCVNTKTRPPRFVVSTPTMEGESDDLRRTKNTAWACAAAFQAIYMANDMFGEPIQSIAIPGLGAGTGKVDPQICAELLHVGWLLFRRKRYSNFAEMEEALNGALALAGLPDAAEADKSDQLSHVDGEMASTKDKKDYTELLLKTYRNMSREELVAHLMSRGVSPEPDLSMEDLVTRLMYLT